MLGERPEEQPRQAVEQIMAATGLDEDFVRALLSVGRVAEDVDAWPRMRAANLGAAADAERLIEAPDDLVAEISERSGVNQSLARHYLVVRHAAEIVGTRDWMAPDSDNWRRLRGLRVLFDFSLPLPTWVDALVTELGVGEDERWRAKDLVVALMALVGPDERAVRAWLATAPEGEENSPAEAAREYGLDALDRRLVAAYPAWEANVDSKGK